MFFCFNPLITGVHCPRTHMKYVLPLHHSHTKEAGIHGKHAVSKSWERCQAIFFNSFCQHKNIFFVSHFSKNPHSFKLTPHSSSASSSPNIFNPSLELNWDFHYICKEVNLRNSIVIIMTLSI